MDYEVKCQNILKPFVAYLRSLDPYAYGDHGSLWIDFGWDICSGEGLVTEAIDTMFMDYMTTVPEFILHWLWWGSFSGRKTDEQIIKWLENNPNDLDKIEVPLGNEILEDVMEDLKSSLRNSAETAYTDYENDFEEDEEDEEGGDWDEEIT